MTGATFDRALQLYQAGQRGEATAVLEDLLRLQPDSPQAWQLRGVIALETGAVPLAIDALQRAVALKPDYAEAQMNLGNALADTGRVNEALSALRAAIRLRPDLAMAHNSLGLVFHKLGQPQSASGAFERAVGLDAGYAEAWTNLGNAWSALGRHEQAIATHARALRLNPDLFAAYANLGAAFRAAGRLPEAIESYQAALARQPDLPDLHNHLGAALRDSGRAAEALEAFQRAHTLAPQDAGTLANLGAVLAEFDRLDEARTCFERSLALRPSAHAHFGLGNIQRDAGELPAALASFRAAVALDPRSDAWSNLLFALNFATGETDESLVRANLGWAARQPVAASLGAFSNSREPERSLRIAYLSSEFRRHHFLAEFLPVLRAHDRQRFRIVCYADVAQPDADTGTVAGLADEFRNLHGFARPAQANQIRADGIDILIGLTGYLARDRDLLTWRLAPLQVTYINHLTTTGLATVDYRIGDAWLDPTGFEIADDPERPLRLQSGFSIYAPAENAPEPGPPPCLASGTLTFGSFNNLTKLTDDTLRLWARLLDRVTGSRLLIKARDLSRPWVAERLRERAEAAGLDASRTQLIGHIADRQENLAAYLQADIGLDPVPFGGGATTREMLWMGLPVIALSGATRAARLGASLLARASLPELVASSADEYLGIAAGLATDRPRLAALRAGLRQRLRQAPLTDAVAHTRELERHYREIWRKWCRNADGNEK